MQNTSQYIKLFQYSSFFRQMQFIFFIVFSGIHLFFNAYHLEAKDFHKRENKIEKGERKLAKIHAKLNLIHGNIKEEFPEQRMVAMYLPKNAVVLELGGNVGRNSCVIASILKNQKNFVSVESSEGIANLLKENRDANGFEFHIESSAISKVSLIQNGWNTMPSDVDVPGWVRVKTISFDELEKKYQLKFDTMIVDSEGSLCQTLRDDPWILENIKLVIIENDFGSREQMIEVQNQFIANGLQCVYNEAYTIDYRACGDSFFQVWKK